MTVEAWLIVIGFFLVLALGAAAVAAVRLSQAGTSFTARLDARLGDLEKSVERIAGEVGRGEAAIRGEVERARSEDREGLKALRADMMSSVGLLVEGLRTSFGDLAMVQKERIASLESALNQVRAGAASDAASLREDVRTTLAQLGDAVSRAISQLSGVQRERLDAVAAEMTRVAGGSEQRQEALRRHIESAMGELRSDATAHARTLAEEIAGRLKLIGDGVAQSVQHASDAQRERFDGFARSIAALSQGLEAKHEALRRAVDDRLEAIRGEHAAKLDQLRLAIDGEIQSVRDLRFFDSVKRVGESLEQAHKALGEMQSIAAGAGNLRALPGGFDSPR